MPSDDPGSLWSLTQAAGNLSSRTLWGVEAGVVLGDLERGSSLGGRIGELRSRSVFLTTSSQLAAALALIELDGVARRIVLCPSDVSREHFPDLMRMADADAVVSDRTVPDPGLPAVPRFISCSAAITPCDPARETGCETEWVLLTSGTTGVPKLVAHTLATLTGAIRAGRTQAKPAVWCTFYDIRRYGGLQILLRTLLGGSSMVLPSAGEPTDDFLRRASARGVTHLLGTPTHWWLALTSSSADRIDPQYVRLSGEIASQAILDRLRARYPKAAVVHAFASTEAGVGFEVTDGLEGFPATLLGHQGGGVEMKVEDGSLRIRSPRTAARYLGNGGESLAGADGFVDTRDLVELRDGRFYFVGRRDGVINIGGQKVHPEEIEAVINSHPRVRMSLVRARKSPITGAVVIAEVVLNADSGVVEAPGQALKDEILGTCRAALPRHKVPAVIQFVPSLAVSATGKIARRNA
jgi:acyl-coenzyme A synthetase/AMP-(fatty) acid ligase